MAETSLKIRQVSSGVEHPVLRVERSWDGDLYLLGPELGDVIRVCSPGPVVLPRYDREGPVSRRAGATALARHTPYPCDVFVAEVVTPSGPKGSAMFAVPRGLEPRFVLDG